MKLGFSAKSCSKLVNALASLAAENTRSQSAQTQLKDNRLRRLTISIDMMKAIMGCTIAIQELRIHENLLDFCGFYTSFDENKHPIYGLQRQWSSRLYSAYSETECLVTTCQNEYIPVSV